TPSTAHRSGCRKCPWTIRSSSRSTGTTRNATSADVARERNDGPGIRAGNGETPETRLRTRLCSLRSTARIAIFHSEELSGRISLGQMDSAAILTMPRDPRTRRGEENDSRNVAAGNRYGAGGWCLGAQSAHESEAVLGRDHPNQTESAAAD